MGAARKLRDRQGACGPGVNDIPQARAAELVFRAVTLPSERVLRLGLRLGGLDLLDGQTTIYIWTKIGLLSPFF